MGTLKLVRADRTQPLTSETVVGRSDAADLRLTDDFVSSLHASIQWSGGHWGIRDLGSHNGTAVNGVVVPPGTRRRLSAGDEVTFGQASATWLVSDAAPPEPIAWTPEGGVEVGSDGLLALPDRAEPALTIFANEFGQWRVEEADEVRPVRDREVVSLGNTSWTLRLPEAVVSTRGATGARAVHLRDVHLTITPSAGERDATVDADHEEDRFSFSVGAQAKLITYLATARSSGSGWVDRVTLLDDLGVTGNRLNVSVWRLRRSFADAGFVDAVALVERDRRRLRLGTGRVTVHAAGPTVPE
ncbi:MAG: FHA domain-containing protein [Myxococcota bacterium]